jgi:hypothetical protein
LKLWALPRICQWKIFFRKLEKKNILRLGPLMEEKD